MQSWVTLPHLQHNLCTHVFAQLNSCAQFVVHLASPELSLFHAGLSRDWTADEDVNPEFLAGERY